MDKSVVVKFIVVLLVDVRVEMLLFRSQLCWHQNGIIEFICPPLPQPYAPPLVLLIEPEMRDGCVAHCGWRSIRLTSQILHQPGKNELTS